MAKIAGKLAELAARASMSSFIKSRLGVTRAFSQFSAMGYLMPRTQFQRLYTVARDVNRKEAELFAYTKTRRPPDRLTTESLLRVPQKYVYRVQVDVFNPEGQFERTREVGIVSEVGMSIEEAEDIGLEKASKYEETEEGWSVQYPRLFQVLKGIGR